MKSGQFFDYQIENQTVKLLKLSLENVFEELTVENIRSLNFHKIVKYFVHHKIKHIRLCADELIVTYIQKKKNFEINDGRNYKFVYQSKQKNKLVYKYKYL